MDIDKFKAYCESIGKPDIQMVKYISFNELGIAYEYGFYNSVNFNDVKWFDDFNYRIANDRHWLLRQKWIESDFKLPIEHKTSCSDWMHVLDPNWRDDFEYREAEIILSGIYVSDHKEKPKRDPSNMRPFEWLYWAFVDAGMEKEAEGMEYMLITIRGALEEAKFQRDKRFELEKLLEKRLS